MHSSCYSNSAREFVSINSNVSADVEYDVSIRNQRAYNRHFRLAVITVVRDLVETVRPPDHMLLFGTATSYQDLFGNVLYSHLVQAWFAIRCAFIFATVGPNAYDKGSGTAHRMANARVQVRDLSCNARFSGK